MKRDLAIGLGLLLAAALLIVGGLVLLTGEGARGTGFGRAGALGDGASKVMIGLGVVALLYGSVKVAIVAGTRDER